MAIPLFVLQESLRQTPENLSLLPCPHCGRVGMLVRHGYLRGRSESGSKLMLRGRRIFCTNRNRRNGCGRTFSIYHADVLKRRSISAHTAWSFLAGVGSGLSLEKSFQSLDPTLQISWSTLQRFWRCFQTNLPAIRSWLVDHYSLQAVAPADPCRETIRHLACHLHDPPLNPIAVFQFRFQKHFLTA